MTAHNIIQDRVEGYMQNVQAQLDLLHPMGTSFEIRRRFETEPSYTLIWELYTNDILRYEARYPKDNFPKGFTHKLRVRESEYDIERTVKEAFKEFKNQIDKENIHSP